MGSLPESLKVWKEIGKNWNVNAANAGLDLLKILASAVFRTWKLLFLARESLYSSLFFVIL